jgi:hypothetical protein
MCLQQHQRATASYLQRTVRGNYKDAAFIASIWIRAVELVGAENVFAFISDGASVNILAAKILQERCDCLLVCIPDLEGI